VKTLTTVGNSVPQVPIATISVAGASHSHQSECLASRACSPISSSGSAVAPAFDSATSIGSGPVSAARSAK